MELVATDFHGLHVLQLKRHEDLRGSFTKCFHASTFADCGLKSDFREDFFSISARGVIRGMHFQVPPADHDKLVYCSRGSVFDVALDLRTTSKTFGQHFSIELSETNGRALYLPSGFAHGFQSLEDGTCLHYKTTSEHDPRHDRGIRWDTFGCDWKALASSAILSERDRAFPALKDFKSPFVQTAGRS